MAPSSSLAPAVKRAWTTDTCPAPAPYSRADLLTPSIAFTFAPFSTNRLTTASWPPSHASINAVRSASFPSMALTSAPASTSTWTTVRCPPMAAYINGVLPDSPPLIFTSLIWGSSC
eukprot:Lithocolla_globosa_v1_NODE_2781_length_1870_cov_5.496419.p5 type:complete len:117 gc:universal NODE_2781_length_1870_cov_5.496419:1832-1482(-)